MIYFQQDFDISSGINEQIQDRVQKTYGNLEAFMDALHNTPEKSTLPSPMGSILSVTNEEVRFAFFPERDSHIASVLLFCPGERPAQSARSIAWNKNTRWDGFDLRYHLFDSNRVLFFVFFLFFVNTYWMMYREWLNSNQRRNSVYFLRAGIAAIGAGIVLAGAIYLLPDTTCRKKAFPLQVGLMNPALSESLTGILLSPASVSEKENEVSRILNTKQFFLATEHATTVPHIRFNLNEYEYYFFIPSGYSPRELNPQMSWQDLGNGFWLGQYRTWLWYRYSAITIVFGLYIASLALCVKYIVEITLGKYRFQKKHAGQK